MERKRRTVCIILQPDRIRPADHMRLLISQMRRQFRRVTSQADMLFPNGNRGTVIKGMILFSGSKDSWKAHA